MAVLLEERHGAVALLRLNRPEALNALDRALVTALGDALERTTADPAVRVVVLAGEGGAFCSGADLKEALKELDGGVSLAERLAAFQRNVRLVVNAPQPVIAAVDGAAVGFGADLALACDLRLLSERAYFEEKFVGIGLMPDGGGTFHLPRLVGLGRALELLLLGERVTAPRAVELGLGLRVVPPSELIEQTLALAARLAEGPPLALAKIKHAARQSLVGTLDDALEREARGQSELLASADLREGILAFKEKRKPRFGGR
ncbi:MAG TPA: enoyl-CoA hydratase-related protein [Polyangiaceae bacterium]|nr:enoyl-CoA hydratase-related protein [Polyangiaceae bacterium]